jgi:adenosylcobinamide-phosphate synthase
MMAALVLILSFLLDRALGEPRNALHPVAWMGHAIGWGRDWALRAGPMGQLVRGAVVTALVCSAAAGIAHASMLPFARWPVTRVVIGAALLKPLFAVRALRDAAFVVRDALDRGNLEEARLGVRSLCSRDPSALGPSAVAAATVESLAENASDSIVAPLLYYGLFGLPGAAFYRAANTLDAMVGYHGRLERVGKVAARLDDLLNLVPARITALLLLAAAASRPADGARDDRNVRRGFAVLRRDGGRTESPNAGLPMATMAGLLGVSLDKEGHYRLGDSLRAVETQDIAVAWHTVSRAALGALALTLLVVAAVGAQ